MGEACVGYVPIGPYELKGGERMKCKFCGKKTKKVLADVTRKEDGKVAENVPVKHCFECNATFLNLEVITYE